MPKTRKEIRLYGSILLGLHGLIVVGLCLYLSLFADLADVNGSMRSGYNAVIIVSTILLFIFLTCHYSFLSENWNDGYVDPATKYKEEMKTQSKIDSALERSRQKQLKREELQQRRYKLECDQLRNLAISRWETQCVQQDIPVEKFDAGVRSLLDLSNGDISQITNKHKLVVKAVGSLIEKATK